MVTLLTAGSARLPPERFGPARRIYGSQIRMIILGRRRLRSLAADGDREGSNVVKTSTNHLRLTDATEPRRREHCTRFSHRMKLNCRHDGRRMSMLETLAGTAWSFAEEMLTNRRGGGSLRSNDPLHEYLEMTESPTFRCPQSFSGSFG